ncbi:uncharacterized protein BX664DRAFT_365351 [Halteromyces radiatus]|uniref:uncharacterized protein n=1 Tax=Halteromyces radiatus TaxID=101107 RepID=UPI00221E5F81|nr:uncharacterized protein BX664DRAFT_365351 [Halteromyces radiatus]KAI8089147.1 hypothetical protein BX664DRAFT_365351 [Halteromyces radiatus]
MGGVFEPFLQPSKKEDINHFTPEVTLADLTLQGKRAKKYFNTKSLTLSSFYEMNIDLLPPDDQLELEIKHKQRKLSLEAHKQVVQYVLTALQDSQPLNSQQLLQLAGNQKSELTALGNMLLRSSKVGTPVSLELYRQAMELGDDQGTFSYANMIYRGYRGTEKQEEKGIQILSKLAQKGHPYAQMNLASILMRSEPDRVKQAIQLYELAGKSGISNAYMELGRMYRLGYGVHQDHTKAMNYFQKGAAGGNPQCHFMLGVYFSSGLGTSSKEPDQVKAFKHFQKAAIKGLPEAQYNVGLRFLKGHGVEANMFNAAEFFTMAASQGFQLAQANLASMYVEGRGVRRDVEQAKHWFGKAAAAGGPIGKEAQQQLDQLSTTNENGGSKCIIM